MLRPPPRARAGVFQAPTSANQIEAITRPLRSDPAAELAALEAWNPAAVSIMSVTRTPYSSLLSAVAK